MSSKALKQQMEKLPATLENRAKECDKAIKLCLEEYKLGMAPMIYFTKDGRTQANIQFFDDSEEAREKLKQELKEGAK